jgi:hypothetical protein
MPERKINRTWLQLVGFCAMTAVALSLALSVLFAGATLAFGLGQSSSTATLGEEASPIQSFSGLVTDSRCGAKHSASSDKTSAECVRSCVRHGAKYTLVDGEKTYTLLGNRNLFDKVAGQRTQVHGTLEGDWLKVTSVSPQ